MDDDRTPPDPDPDGRRAAALADVGCDPEMLEAARYVFARDPDGLDEVLTALETVRGLRAGVR